MLIVHIGAKKAGSSSIQTFLSANEKLLRRFSIDYTRIGRTEIDSRRSSDRKPAKAMANNRRSECKIVFIIRDLAHLVPSIFSQQTRHGSDEASFDELFERMMAHPRTDFFNTAERWASVFGWSAMEIRTLDNRDLRNGDLLDEFVSIMGAEQIEDQLKKTTNRNVSRSWKSLEAVRALCSGKHGLPSDHPILVAPDRARDPRLLGRAAMIVSDKLGWDHDTARYLTAEQAERCRDRYCIAVENINRHVARKIPMPVDLKASGFIGREFEPDVSRIPRAELRSFYDEVWSFIEKDATGDRTTSHKVPRNHKNIAVELNKKDASAQQSGFLDLLSREWRDREGSTLILSSEFFERTGRQGVVKLRKGLSIRGSPPTVQ